MIEEFDYKTFVLECYNKKLDKEIHNASTENALLLFKTLLDKAIRDKEDVRIVSGSLLASFYNEITQRVQKIINNGNTVRVIVEGDINDKNNNKFYQTFKENITDARIKFKGLPNFIVVGNNSYRYEKNKRSHQAIANFNNISMGSFMQKIFNDLLKDIKTVS